MKKQKETKQEKKTTTSNFRMFATVIAVLIVVAVLFLSVQGIFSGQGNVITSGSTGQNTYAAPSDGEVQYATLKLVNYAYVIDKPLKVGVPVQLTADLNSLVGCTRDVVIPSFGVRKYVRQGDNIIEFTPDKAGTFKIACSMNMARGTFTVEDNSGSVPQTSAAELSAQEALLGGGSCGAGGGGCGCGGGR